MINWDEVREVLIGETWYKIIRAEDTFVVIGNGLFSTPIDKKFIKDVK